MNIRFVIFVWVLLFNSTWVTADPSVIKVGLVDSEPWAYQVDDGNVAGVYPQLFRRIQAELDDKVRFEFVILPLPRLLHSLKENQELHLGIYSFKPERSYFAVRQLHLFDMAFILASHKDRPIRSVAELDGKKLSVLAGGSGCPCDPTLKIRRIAVKSHANALRMLAADRVQALSGPSVRILHQANRLGLIDQLAAPVPYQWREVWLWRAEKSEHSQMPAVIKQLQNYLDSGQLLAELQRYTRISVADYVK